FGCSITVDNYSNQIQPQIIVKDVMITD
ncbi:MAG: hypothetical protein CFH14_01078, partial [Alphaproteobacteria bacterium MarineAlpha5_Bin4]